MREVLLRVTGGYDTVTGLPFKRHVESCASKRAESRRSATRHAANQPRRGFDATTQEKLDALIRAGVLDPNGSLDDDHIADLSSASATRAQLVTTLARLYGGSGRSGAPPRLCSAMRGIRCLSQRLSSRWRAS